MPDSKFIVVSNRLPVTVSKTDGKLKFTPSSGGLATAMSSVETDGEMVWIGWPGINSDELTPADRQKITRELKKYNCAPVFLSAELVEKFYEGYSNETLWPLFHYFQSLTQYNEENWAAYKKVNRQFNKVVLRHADKTSTVWVHDYHLMLLPDSIRQSLPSASIGFFLHIPFPSFELFRLLPHRKELMKGLLGADLVGFHTYDYVRHFTSTVLRTLGYESQNGSIIYKSRIVKADAFPIGIDYEKFKKAATSPQTDKEIEMLDEHYGDKKIILSVDRLDYSKGIAQRLEAYEQFLRENPRHHKKVTLVVIAVPSRTGVDAYKDLRDQIEQTVSRINGKFASVDWVPVAYQFQNLPFDKLAALYAKADIALITPVRDGMNLVAKEYVASKQKSPGVIILSELAGAVDEMPEALIINPNDKTGIVDALNYALKMPNRQKKKRISAMQRRISSYNVQRWAGDFLEQLSQSKEQQSQLNSRLLNEESKSNLLNKYEKAKKRLIILDYDGTLRPFVKSARPSDAAPSKKLLELLSKLTSDTKNTVYVLSGRTKEALDQWFDKVNVRLVAEHGFWVKEKTGWISHKLKDTGYKNLALPTLIKYTERTPGAVLEDKNFSLVWHYRNVAPELAYARRKNLKHDLHELLSDTDADVYGGNKILEVKPKNMNKGVIARQLMDKQNFDFILCCGDDTTDEDMFRVFSNEQKASSIKVGLGNTAAKQQVSSVKDVYSLLESLT